VQRNYKKHFDVLHVLPRNCELDLVGKLEKKK
jgi:hypothetical protein